MRDEIKLLRLSKSFNIKENVFFYALYHNKEFITIDKGFYSFYIKDNWLFVKNKGLNQSAFKKLLLNIYSFYKGSRTNFYLQLVITGTGYRFLKPHGGELSIKAGYSNMVKIKVPENISLIRLTNTSIVILSFDYNLLKLFGSHIKKIRVPDVYKGKGIKYFNEIISLKTIKK